MQIFSNSTNNYPFSEIFSKMLLLALLLTATGSLLAQSATQTATVVASNGSGNDWSPLTASNLANSDGNRISATAGTPTQFLDLTGFNFNLPPGATIDGIEVAIERQKSGGNRNIRDNTIQLLKAGSPVGQNKAVGTNWPTSDATANYGGTTDLWMTTWTEAEIEASGFGLRIAIENFGGSGPARDGQINLVQITVHYTAGGGGSSCISVDATSTTTASGAVSSITLNHSTGTGNNRLMLVGISIEQDDGGTANITGVTYGSQTLSLVNPAGSTSGEAQAQIWQLVNPASGSGTLTVNVSGADNDDAFVVGVTTFEGVDQSTPLLTPATSNTDGTSPSEITVNSVPSDDVVFAVIAHDDARPIKGSTVGSQTILWDVSENQGGTDGITGSGAFKPGTGGNVTLSWTLDDEDDGSSLVAVRVQCAGCSLSGLAAANVNCNDNGTANDPTDDYVTFELNFTGQGPGTYAVTADDGSGPVAVTLTNPSGGPATGQSYAANPTFSLPVGTADNGVSGGGRTYTITVTDESDGTCNDTATINPVNECSDCPVDPYSGAILTPVKN